MKEMGLLSEQIDLVQADGQEHILTTLLQSRPKTVKRKDPSVATKLGDIFGFLASSLFFMRQCFK
jgi:hypothetical protein